MSINKKLVKIFQEVSELKFTKEDMTIMNNVEFLADRTVKDKIRPIFVKNGVTPISSNQYDKANGVVRIHVVYINDEDDTEFTQTVEHPINDLLWGGGNITLANKYAYILLLMIGTSDDVNPKPGANVNTEAPSSFQRIEKKHGVTKDEVVKGGISKRVPVSTEVKAAITPEIEAFEAFIFKGIDDDKEFALNAMKEEVIEQPEIGFPDGTPMNLQSLVSNVVKTEKLEPIAEKVVEKREDEPDTELHARLNKGWKEQIALEDCLSELTALKVLDNIYKSKGVEIYAHTDLDKCPVNPRVLIDKLNQRPSTLRVRNFLIQFRVFGEEAFWQQLVGQFNISKEAGLAAMSAAPVVVVEKTPTLPIVKLEIPFEISEGVGGDRPMEDILAILKGLNGMGITKWAIMASLEKMTNKLALDANEPADSQISSFIAKGSVAQIEEMIKIAMT